MWPNVPKPTLRRHGQRGSRHHVDRSNALNRPASAPVPTLLNKVPQVTLTFWSIKIMSTTVGETGADYLAVHVGLGTAITGAIMVALLIGALVGQVRSGRYVPWLYWL